MNLVISKYLISSLLVWGLNSQAAELNNNTHFQMKVNDTSMKSVVTSVMTKIGEERLKDRIPGISVSVFNNKGMLFSGGSGVGDLATNQAIDPSRSLFRVASVSKLFTVIALGQLMDRGEFDMNTPIMQLGRAGFVNIIKNCPQKNSKWLESWNKIKVGHLMSHQSGISKDLPGSNVFWDKSALEDGAYPSFSKLEKGLCNIELLFEPGKIPRGMKYSNLGFNLLARIVEAYNPRSSSFQQYVKSNVFRPLWMRNSSYDLGRFSKQNLTTGYSNFGADINDTEIRSSIPKVLKVESYDGSIGVATTTEDMSKLGGNLLKLMSSNKNWLGVSEAQMYEILNPVSQYNSSLSWSRGFMWYYWPGQSGTDPLWVGHTGTGYGERILLMVAPELNLGIALEFNSRTANREKYAKMISDALIAAGLVKKQKLTVKTTELLVNVRSFIANTNLPKPVKPELAPATEELKDFVGTYVSSVTGRHEISASKNGKLVMLGFELETIDVENGKFRFPPEAGVYFSSELLQFLKNDKGIVVGIQLAQVKYAQKLLK